MSSGHHIYMERRLRRKHPKLNCDTDASNEAYLKEMRKFKHFPLKRREIWKKNLKTWKRDHPQMGFSQHHPCPPRPRNRILPKRKLSFLQSELLDYFVGVLASARTTGKRKKNKMKKEEKWKNNRNARLSSLVGCCRGLIGSACGALWCLLFELPTASSPKGAGVYRGYWHPCDASMQAGWWERQGAISCTRGWCLRVRLRTWTRW